MKFASAILVFAFALTAVAQDDGYDQVIPPIPVPAGEFALDTLKEVKLTDKTVLTTYIDKSKGLRGKGPIYGMGNLDAKVKCSLSASNVKFSNFNEVTRESVGGSIGARFYISPRKSISLKYKTSSLGVEQIEPACNGEPEICEANYPTYGYRTIITLTDKSSNEWDLSCLAPFSRELYFSDVKINGIEIK